MTQTFQSKVDALIVWPIIIITMLIFFFMAIDGVWPGMIFIVILDAFILFTLYGITYTIDQHFLLIKTGFFRYAPIDIYEVRSIDFANNGISSPAASLDRINLQCGKKGTITLSPKNKDRFIQLLLSINSEIIIKRKSNA